MYSNFGIWLKAKAYTKAAYFWGGCSDTMAR